MQTGPARRQPVSLRSHLAFVLGSAVALLALFSLLRLGLLGFNRELIGGTSAQSLGEAFVNGLRFDLRVVAFILAPLLLATLDTRAMAARGIQRGWLAGCAGLAILLAVIELNFYREFHQRLDSLVFQYLAEDPATVLSMLWHGFPVLRLLALCAFTAALMFGVFGWIERRTRALGPASPAALRWRALALLPCVLVSAVAVRGTLRQGPPLRWGDAFTTDSPFANHLGLNPVLTLFDAARHRYSSQRGNAWKPVLPPGQAQQITRKLLLTANDRLVDAESAAVRRVFQPPAAGRLPVRNVVVILMESFAGRFVGALGSRDAITPNFDRLAREGVLFERFFSNGTHTHQGMFASMACFPNLPGFEYLMQTPEGGQRFSGLPQLLGDAGFDNLYVYNGDFAWDNQLGFFGNQGMTHFVGRNDFVAPVVSDPTWGVSDQDMFDRAIEELAKLDGERPFYALLQTLSNHTPYALPDPLPVAPVTGHGSLDEHLTAMRYADWALGRFFEQARKLPGFDETLFVIVGDHDFGTPEQVTEMDLHRFHVPLLLIAPDIAGKFGSRRATVGTQVDVVPTIIGRLGGSVSHQCWGRDLLGLPADDPGFAVIKPSGSDQTVAIVRGEEIVVLPSGGEPRAWRFRLGAQLRSERLATGEAERNLLKDLQAYLQTATASLLAGTAGAGTAPPRPANMHARPARAKLPTPAARAATG